MKSIAAAVLTTICFATPLFAQTPTQPPTSTPAMPTTPVQQPSPTTTGAPVATATPSLANSELGTAALLVERALAVLDKAANTKTGDVTLDRGLIDEVRAELAQVKATLQAEKK